MNTEQAARTPNIFELNRNRLALFAREVDSLMEAHDEAMDCLNFEETLGMGVSFYDAIMRLDERIRADVLDGKAAYDQSQHQQILDLVKWWLQPCAELERLLTAFSRKGYKIEQAAAFRARHAEAKWLLLPDAEKFAHEKIVALRDDAIDLLRSDAKPS